MTEHYSSVQLEAFRLTAEVVRKEAVHLKQTHGRLFAVIIDASWVKALDADQDSAERVEAFVSRFGRLQDTLGEKMLTRMASLAGQRPMAMIELLANAEKLGWIASADKWLEWRKLRNRLVHEYMTDAAEFAQALKLADIATFDLLDAEATIRNHATRLGMLNR